MSKKVDQIEKNDDKTPLQIGNVSVVRGESKISEDSLTLNFKKTIWTEWEINGALSLFNQQYYPNTVVKLHKILERNDYYNDCGKVYFYIAQSLEILKMDGQAIEAYQSVIDFYLDQECADKESKQRFEESQFALDILKKEIEHGFNR